MRRFSSVISAAALALGLTLGLPGGTARAAAGFDSSYQFESAFLNLKPGDSGTFAVFFANTGSTAWVKGTSSQVNLSICDASKIFCNTTSANAAFASGWLSSIAYATHTKDVVSPGDFSPFSYTVKAPAGQATGTFRFNGDLVLASTGERIHPEGYYQDATVTAPSIQLGVTPGYDVSEDNEVSSTVPGNGQHTYTFTFTFSGTVSFAILTSGNISRNADGSYSFCDTNQDKKADGVGAGATFFTAINGSSVAPSTVLINQTIPSNGTITATIDSSTRNQRVRIVAWQDKNQNGQIDLVSAGTDTTCNTMVASDTTVDGLMVVSGRKFYFGPKGQFGTQFPDGTGAPSCNPVYRHDSSTQTFSAGPTSDTSLRFTYDSNDTFKISGTQISMSVFQSSLNAQPDGSGSTIKINYDPNPAGFSTFDLCNLSGANAPSNVSGAVGNFDAGSSAEDVRISFTAPSNNQVTTYNIQRATTTGAATGANCALGTAAPASSDSSGTPVGTSFSTVGSVNVTAGQTGTFTNFDLANGGYCYRVTVQNPTVGTTSYSNYVFVNIPGTGDAIPPTSTNAGISTSAGFSNTLDAGDKIFYNFSEPMSIAANAVIRVTDSDCGPATNAGPAACSGSLSNTVADIICGTNATCALNSPNELVITMTSNPTVVSAGSTSGSQFPVVVTDSNGVTDVSGNAWNLTCAGQSSPAAAACANGTTPKRVIP